MAKLNPQKFADFCENAKNEGAGYIMCAIGQDPKKLSDWYFNQYKGNPSQYAKALYWKKNAPHVYDCQGLADCFVGVNVRARNNYADWCATKGTGKIPVKYRVPGAAVFVHNGDYISHVGFLIKPVTEGKNDGDWYVIEARGVMYGVVRTKLLNRTWNRWGLMDKYFDYTDVLKQYHGDTAQPVKALGDRTLRKGDSGEDVKMLQACLMDAGYELAKYGADGDFGDETEKAVNALKGANDLDRDGIYGVNAHAALMAEIEGEKDDDTPAEIKKAKITAAGTWNVRKGPGTNYDIKTIVKQGAEFDYVSTAENGWIQIEINDGTGWVSPKCARVV